MKPLKLATSLSILAALACVVPQAAPPSPAAEALCREGALQGAWEDEGGTTRLLFKDDQIVVHKDGALTVAMILKQEKSRLQIRYQGMRSTWTVICRGDMPVLEGVEPQMAWRLRRLSTIPPVLDLTANILPPPRPVHPNEVEVITQELLRRAAADQDAVKDPALRTEILAENLRYLRELTLRVGWIDIQRFGKRAASAAILIVKHASDLRLMKAALPIVERDVKEHGGSGEMFSVLYDELQITLGHQQRYGTQLVVDPQGNPLILPLEDSAKVDVYRKAIGILSFDDYLKLVSDNMGGASIRVAGSDE